MVMTRGFHGIHHRTLLVEPSIDTSINTFISYFIEVSMECSTKTTCKRGLKGHEEDKGGVYKVCLLFFYFLFNFNYLKMN